MSRKPKGNNLTTGMIYCPDLENDLIVAKDQLIGYRELLSQEIKLRIRLIDKFLKLGPQGIPSKQAEKFSSIIKNPLKGI